MITLAIVMTVIALSAAYCFAALRAEARRQEWRRQNRSYNLKHQIFA